MQRVLILSMLAGAVAAWVAGGKGRNWVLWGLLTALFPFLLIVVLFLPPVVAAGYTRKCPYCAEVIKQEATVCKHCGRELPIDMVLCSKCGKYVPDGDYCSECRHSLRG